MKIEKLDQKNETKELLPQIVKRIFAICKTDPHFPLKNELGSVEDRLEDINKKIKKQDDLLKQSKTLKEDFTQRIEMLNDSNMRKQSELLENLGSEL